MGLEIFRIWGDRCELDADATLTAIEAVGEIGWKDDFYRAGWVSGLISLIRVTGGKVLLGGNVLAS